MRIHLISSDTDDEVIVVKPKKKSELKQVTKDLSAMNNEQITKELAELKELLTGLTIKKKNLVKDPNK